MRAILLASTAITLTCVPASAWAQQEPVSQPQSTNEEVGAPTPGAAVVSADAGATGDGQETPAQEAGLENIVITAQRRAESLQNAAIPVTAVTSDAIVNAGVTDADQLSTVVPALQTGAAAGPYNLFYLRGVGNFNGNALTDAAIAFNRDGVYIARTSSTSGVFFDLERVEVLKGPQGPLYGRNATGGAINVITRRPELGVFGGEAMIEYGNYDNVRFTGAINGPIGDEGGIRAAVQNISRDGYLSDGTDDEESQAGRVQMRGRLTPSLTVNVTADYYHQGGSGGGALILNRGLALEDRVGLTDPRSDAIFSQTLFFPAGNFLAPLPENQFTDNEHYGAYAQIDWETSLGTLTVLPAYRHSDLDFRSIFPSFVIDQLESDDQTSLEVRFASADDTPFGWLVGAYYINEDIDFVGSYNQHYTSSWQQFETGTESWAAFGRLSYAFTEAFRVTGGIRYTDEQKYFDGIYTAAGIICPAAFGPPPNPVACVGGPQLPYSLRAPDILFAPNGAVIPVRPFGTRGNLLQARQFTRLGEDSFNAVTWRAGVEYDLTPRNLLYGSVETGYKSGGFFFSRGPNTYEPERLTAFTLGAKNRFLRNRLQVNLEAFYWRYRNQQISATSRDIDGNVIFATQNVGRSTVKGIEAETQLLLGENTLLSADVQYLDATYDSFIYNVPNLGSAPASDCVATAAGPVYTVDCSGRTAPQSPEWTFNFGIQQTVPLGNLGELVLMARTHFQTETVTGLEFLPDQVQDDYWTSDAQITFNAPGERWSVTGFINNIEDEEILNASFPHPLAGRALVSGSLRAPRTYGIRLGVRW